jgi:putative tryptophan/tyrosine transport system substrate-binding protein
MRRRQFLGLLGGTTVAWPLATRAQQPARIPCIAALMPFAEDDPEGQRRIAAFHKGLQELGWLLGQNVRIEPRWVGGDPERIRIGAREVVESNPDVILAVTALTVAPLRAQTGTIPIVFTNIGDPVSSGFVASLANPGGNITGFTAVEFSVWGKQLEILKEVVPSLTRVAVIYNPEQGPQLGMIRAVETVAPSIAVKIARIEVRQPLEQAIDGFALQGEGGGLIVFPNPVADSNRDLIVRVAARHKLPSIFAYRYYVTSGGLMSYGIDTATPLKQAAIYVDRILRGAKPADLPVQQPTKFELVVNLKTAKALGLTMSDSFLLRADEVIE